MHHSTSIFLLNVTDEICKKILKKLSSSKNDENNKSNKMMSMFMSLTGNKISNEKKAMLNAMFTIASTSNYILVKKGSVAILVDETLNIGETGVPLLEIGKQFGVDCIAFDCKDENAFMIRGLRIKTGTFSTIMGCESRYFGGEQPLTNADMFAEFLGCEKDKLVEAYSSKDPETFASFINQYLPFDCNSSHSDIANLVNDMKPFFTTSIGEMYII